MTDGPYYLPRNRWGELKKIPQIREQIEIRAKLSREMVGSLYPSIITDEVSDLLEMIDGMTKDRIWVICIKYDYGVCDQAGYFTSYVDAIEWITFQKAREQADWEEGQEDGDDWPEYIPTKYYAAELNLAKYV